MKYPIASRFVAGLLGAWDAWKLRSTLRWGGTSTGSANAQIVTLLDGLPLDLLRPGASVEFIAGYSNSGAMTLQVDGTAATSLRDTAGSALVGGEVVAGTRYIATWDGTYWRLGFIPSRYATKVDPKFAGAIVEESNTRSNTGSAITLTMRSVQRYTLTGSPTVTLPSVTPATNEVLSFTVDFLQDGTGGRAVTYATPSGSGQTIAWNGGSPPPLNGTANKRTMVWFQLKAGETVWIAGLSWREG